MSDGFVITTLSILFAIWAVAVLRRPARGLQADPVEAVLAVWLQLPQPSSAEAGGPCGPMRDDVRSPNPAPSPEHGAPRAPRAGLRGGI